MPHRLPSFAASLAPRGLAAALPRRLSPAHAGGGLAALAAAGRSLGNAAQHFKAVATVVVPWQSASEEHAHECASLERVATQNRLACIVAQRALSSSAPLSVSFVINQHRSFPVAVLKSKK